jgi:hypothetical protein
MDTPVFAAHLLDDGRWEVFAMDDDPRRPPWIRIAIVTVPGKELTPSERRVCGARRRNLDRRAA